MEICYDILELHQNGTNAVLCCSVVRGGRRYRQLLPCDPPATFPIILKISCKNTGDNRLLFRLLYRNHWLLNFLGTTLIMGLSQAGIGLMLSKSNQLGSDTSWYVYRDTLCDICDNMVSCALVYLTGTYWGHINHKVYSSPLLAPKWVIQYVMVTSCHRNALHMTGPLCGESTSHQWIHLTNLRASNARFSYFFGRSTVCSKAWSSRLTAMKIIWGALTYMW